MRIEDILSGRCCRRSGSGKRDRAILSGTFHRTFIQNNFFSYRLLHEGAKYQDQEEELGHLIVDEPVIQKQSKWYKECVFELSSPHSCDYKSKRSNVRVTGQVETY